jgi:hypothetical protein
VKAIGLLLYAAGLLLARVRLPLTPAPPTPQAATPIPVPSPSPIPRPPDVVPPTSWYFAVSGDSRDCGDLIMPKIARSIETLRAAAPVAFYWHLGDFRNGRRADRDFVLLNGNDDDYHERAWDDFINRQVKPLEAQTQVFLGIGNHELVFPWWSHEEFFEKFGKWLIQEPIRTQRVADRSRNVLRDEDHIDYHFVKNGIDFIYMDNSDTYAFTPEYLLHPAFTPEQIRWLDGVLEGDAGDPAIRAIVVAMHAALPGSTGSSHAMDDTCRGRRSGQTVYDMLYKAQRLGEAPEKRKRVYVLASHSHDFQENIFEKGHRGKVLPGWIIGTAGAAQHTGEIHDGYLLFEARPDATQKGTFQEIRRDSPPVAGTAAERELTDFCYSQNVEAPHRMRNVNCGEP